MSTTVVFTFIGADKPGLVEKLSNTVSQHGGNWLESRMSQLAGYFAGITRVQISNDQREKLCRALEGLSTSGLQVNIQSNDPTEAATTTEYRHLQLNLIGNDRPGIVRELTSALAARQINVCEMNTHVSSAPMTAETLFEANADIQVPASLDINELSDKLDEIANDLSVDINLESPVKN